MMRRFSTAAPRAMLLSLAATTATTFSAANTQVANNAALRFQSTTATPKEAFAKAAAEAREKARAAEAGRPTVRAYDFPGKVLKNRLWESFDAGRHIKVYVDSGITAWVVMDRAASSANALGDEFVSDLSAALDIVEKLVAENKAQYMILTSAKSTFCVGADIDQMYPLVDREMAKAVPTVGHEVFKRIEAEKFPVIAAINGLALGGGFELSLACHNRLMSTEAKVGFPECMLGLLPGGGGTVRTQRLCGLAKTVQWILSSQQIKAPAAKKAGAVDAVIPGADRYPGENRFFEGVRSWAALKYSDKPPRPATRKSRTMVDKVLEGTYFGRRKVASEAIKMLNKRTKGKYIAQYKALECVMYSATHTNDQGYQKECDGFADLLTSPEAKNQMSIYFLDEGMKKSEQKTGVSKSRAPLPKKVGVIGAGVMGAGIVHYFANKDIPVAVKDLKQEAVDKGIAHVRGEFMKRVKRNRMDQATLERKMALVTGGTTDAVFKDVDVIVEAAVEVMEIKKKVIQQLEADGVITGSNLFATNTSSLSLTEMQSVSKYPQNIVGMHFFNPVEKMPLVEVIKGKQTSPEAAAIIFNLALKTGKKPIIVNDAPGFLVNRILGVYMAEAGRMVVDDRCDPRKIDEVIVNFGMPMGPFRLLDEVGLDVACHVGPVLQGGLKSDRFAVSEHINKMCADGNLGRKNGKGFYLYDEKGKDKGFNMPLVAQYLGGNTSSTLTEADIVDRCTLLMVNEATYILAEGVAQSPEDVDIGMIWGSGFPPFRGGLCQYADHRGIKNVVDTLKALQAKTKSDRFKPSEMLEKMARDNTRFYPNRPFVPYQERHGSPKVSF